jgi:hypothetical protein
MTGCTTAGLCQTWAKVMENPHLHIQRIFQGGCLTDDLSKPLALILSSTYDNNGALALTMQRERSVFENLTKSHTVCHRYVQDGMDAADHLEQLGRRKKIDLLLMRAHGASHFQAYENEVISSFSPAKFVAALRSSLSLFATIILYSCFNAVTCGVDDFAGFMRSAAPPLAMVYGAARSTDRLEIGSKTPLKIRMFDGDTDVTYRSGTDGYCMSPTEPIEAQKHVLRSLSYLVEEDDQGIDAAILAASKAFRSRDLSIRDKAFDLLNKILEKGQGIDAVLDLTSEALKSRDLSIRKMAIRLRKMIRERPRTLKY